MRRLLLTLALVLNWQCQTGKPQKKQVTVDLTEEQTRGLFSLSGSPQKFKSLSAGGWHTCGLRKDGTAKCCGYNGNGQSERIAKCSHAREGDCDLTDGCVWDPSEGGGNCISKTWVACSWVKSQSACNDVGCVWDTDKCISTWSWCSSGRSEKACQDLKCTWNRESSVCEKGRPEEEL